MKCYASTGRGNAVREGAHRDLLPCNQGKTDTRVFFGVRWLRQGEEALEDMQHRAIENSLAVSAMESLQLAPGLATAINMPHGPCLPLTLGTSWRMDLQTLGTSWRMDLQTLGTSWRMDLQTLGTSWRMGLQTLGTS